MTNYKKKLKEVELWKGKKEEQHFFSYSIMRGHKKNTKDRKKIVPIDSDKQEVMFG